MGLIWDFSTQYWQWAPNFDISKKLVVIHTAVRTRGLKNKKMTFSKMYQWENCHDVNLGCFCHVSLQTTQMQGAGINISRAELYVLLVSGFIFASERPLFSFQEMNSNLYSGQ